MQNSDRPEFDIQITALCAGFNVPVGDRLEAYWKGLQKMSMGDVARCVEYALGENGPEKIPTTGQLWGIKRKLRAVGAVAVPTVGADGKPLPSIQEQLCAYAALMLIGRDDLRSFPWTYVYREWSDEKGNQSAECTGIVIDADDGKRMGWSVSMMLGDPEGHAEALRYHKPGPRPTPAQMDTWNHAKQKLTAQLSNPRTPL